MYQACCRTGHELLLEVILPSDMEQNEEYYAEIITHFYHLALTHWWKLPGVSAKAWAHISEVIQAR